LNHHLTLKSLLIYGSLAAPLAMLGLPLYIYLPTYYSQTIGMDIAIVGIVLFLARLSDVFIDPFIGYKSDSLVSRFGKRKPFIAIGSLILAVSFYAIINPPQQYQALWLWFFATLVYVSWSLVSIPYLALNAEISSDVYQKTRLSSARELFALLGLVLALLIPYLYNISEDANKSLGLLFDSFIIILVCVLPFALLGISSNKTSSQSNLSFYSLKILWTNSPHLLRLQSAFVLNSLANALPATLFLFYVEFVLKVPEKTGIFLLLYFIAGIVALPFWTNLSRTLGKAKSWNISMILASVAFAFVPFLDSGDVYPFIIITILSGLSLGADMALPSSIQADIVQNLQTTDTNLSGLLFGIWAMLTKISIALAVGIGFVALGIVEFEPKNPSQNSILILTFLYGTAPVVLKLLAVSIMRKYHGYF